MINKFLEEESQIDRIALFTHAENFDTRVFQKNIKEFLVSLP